MLIDLYAGFQVAFAAKAAIALPLFKFHASLGVERQIGEFAV